MSVELEIQAVEPLKASLVRSSIAELLEPFGTAQLAWSGDDGSIGGGEFNARLRADGGEIAILCYSAGPSVTLGPDGGWWIAVSIVERSAESFLLCVVAAYALSVRWRTPVLDESRLLRRGREVSPDEVACLLKSARGPTFSGAAGLLCRNLGLSFGG